MLRAARSGRSYALQHFSFYACLGLLRLGMCLAVDSGAQFAANGWVWSCSGHSEGLAHADTRTQLVTSSAEAINSTEPVGFQRKGRGLIARPPWSAFMVTFSRCVGARRFPLGLL
jgi:hypothetical protein